MPSTALSTDSTDRPMPLWAWVLVELDTPDAERELARRLEIAGCRREPLRLRSTSDSGTA